jgi:hypothetical protein
MTAGVVRPAEQTTVVDAPTSSFGLLTKVAASDGRPGDRSNSDDDDDTHERDADHRAGSFEARTKKSCSSSPLLSARPQSGVQKFSRS